MNADLLLDNLTNPALLFFVLGIITVLLKSDLQIPENSSKFISLYLLFSIGFKGGQELSHKPLTAEIGWSMLFGIAISVLIPLVSFFIMKRKMDVFNAGAVAAAYGSVSAVTFVTAVSYLEAMDMQVHGHMVAIMALMESPAIITGLLLITIFNKDDSERVSGFSSFKHSFTNGSVMMILGSLVIGFLASEEQAQGIRPFTTDIFKGFLAVFLLDMGIQSGKRIGSFLGNGPYTLLFALIAPLIIGCIVATVSSIVTQDISNRFLFAILGASASYIAVPAAMKIAVPRANPSIFLPMALAVTFPINITLGMPLYMWIASQ